MKQDIINKMNSNSLVLLHSKHIKKHKDPMLRLFILLMLLVSIPEKKITLLLQEVKEHSPSGIMMSKIKSKTSNIIILQLMHLE